MGSRELSRYELLKQQFQLDDLELTTDTEQSLERIFSFIYEQTNLYYLVFIRQELFVQYISYHASIKFREVPFVQVMKDIKLFLQFLAYKLGNNNVPKVDFSLLNLNLWKKI